MRSPPMTTRKTFCEFFAGIGLVRAGLEASGWNCIYANDIDPAKGRGYAARFGADHFHLGDIADTEQVLARLPSAPFLATASFPCVDLSLAGHYRGLTSGGQSSTLFAFGDALAALGSHKPAVVLLENVPGFLTSNNGADFVAAAKLLASLGYWLDAIVLDARHFTPQSRPRVFLIGIAPELVPVPALNGRLWPEAESTPLRPKAVSRFWQTLELETGWATLPLPTPPDLAMTLSGIIDTDEAQSWWPSHELDRHCAMMSEAHAERISQIRASDRPWVGTIFRRVRQNVVRAEVRFDGLAGCLRTPRGGSARQIVIAIDCGEVRMKWMTPREYARLQGAPEFPLVGTATQQLWGFADAVCVPAISWLDRHVLTPLYLTARKIDYHNMCSRISFQHPVASLPLDVDRPDCPQSRLTDSPRGATQ